MKLSGVFVTHAKKRTGHGIAVTLHGLKEHDFNSDDLYLEVHGVQLWKTLPSLVKNFAGFILPMKIRHVVFSESHKRTHTLRFLLGAYKLSHATLHQQLDALISNGDPHFVLELKGKEGRTICTVPTTASAIKSSLLSTKQLPSAVHRCGEVTGENILVPCDKNGRDITPDSVGRRPQATILTWARWLFLPLLFVLCCWFLWFFPDHFSFFPRYIASWESTVRVTEVLPLTPQLASEAWELGYLTGKLEALQKISGSNLQAIFHKAANIVGRNGKLS